jgi:hypothetical protein
MRTEPRRLWMHVMVDALIAFCATALVLAFFGVPLWVMIVVGWCIGLAVAPFTRRLDERQLLQRQAGDPSRRLDDDATKG